MSGAPMSIVAIVVSLAGAVALIAAEISIDAGLWAGVALLAISSMCRPASRPAAATMLPFAGAMLLTSLALVAA
jgi:hypothetical protein